MVKTCIVSVVSVGIDFNVATHSFNYVCGFYVRFVVCGVNFDAGTLLALLIGDLAAVSVQLVNRQDRARFKVAGVLQFNGPLVTIDKL